MDVGRPVIGGGGTRLSAPAQVKVGGGPEAPVKLLQEMFFYTPLVMVCWITGQTLG